MKQFLLLTVFLVSMVLSAQNTGTVTGEIMDSEMYNEPLMFAHVSLKGTKTQTRTNLWGRFELTDIAPGDYMLNVSFAGYESVELPFTITSDGSTHVSGKLKAKSVSENDAAQFYPTENAQVSAPLMRSLNN
ncbi:carboxypeptidase-like regulatory domain-containing protein [Arenibacter sp. GZD96]|uniref:carboxypeptidase-like regulatory domain-containing protein n=1 Tax=Aurantibrevibacter litoralis TaxID=3106030 RepID=UPI002AFFFB64|nr:carboxypeptidase-like regulatory domain-containing protein [Arenibacter sp. GZD-96]MEA1787602.1 carboxypeptidase-like regulatory domain-containing protein [Arenibacter sp. GZD-96]